MKLLLPGIEQYPFDCVCNSIVREIKARNYSVPGIRVEFHTYGSGDAWFRNVDKIIGNNFELSAGRTIRRRIYGTDYCDNSAVHEILIPRMRLRVYRPGDGGVTLHQYAGPNWEQDSERFRHGWMCHSKLDNEPRLYLVYKGECHGSSGQFWPARLAADNDLGREYDPKPWEPKSYETDKVFREITEWLEKNVLAYITAQPLPAEELNPFSPETPIPVPTPSRLGPLFTFADYRECSRIIKGQAKYISLEPAERYALDIDYRFLELGIPDLDGTIPEAAYHGSVWCGIGRVDENSSVDNLEIPGLWGSLDKKYVVHVNPNRANDVYIADMQPYETARANLFGKRDKNYHLTNAEVKLCAQASGRTVIPLTAYSGGYSLPVVLINRQLDFDEVQILSGPDLDKIRKRVRERLESE